MSTKTTDALTRATAALAAAATLFGMRPQDVLHLFSTGALTSVVYRGQVIVDVEMLAAADITLAPVTKGR